MKKKNEINSKIEQMEKTEKENEKKNKVRYAPGRRGTAVGVTLTLCVGAVVGGYFLVKQLLDSSAANQTSNAPSQSYDEGSVLPSSAASTSDISIKYPAESTTIRDTGAISDSGAGTEPVEAVPGSQPGESSPDPGGDFPAGDSIILPDLGEDDIVIGFPDDYDVTIPSGTGGEDYVDDVDDNNFIDPFETTSSSRSTTATSHTAASSTATGGTTAASSTGSTSSQATTAKTTEATVPTFATTSYSYQWSVPDIDNPETFEGDIGDFFN